MNRFKMTSDRFHFWTPVVLIPIFVAQAFGFGWALKHTALPLIAVTPVVLVLPMFVVLTLMTPTAVRLRPNELELERLFWPSFRVPLRELVSVEEGPRSAILTGQVRRVAGVGGWFWSGGLFRADGVGLVRAWLRRLGPTLVIRRKEGKPLLLAVDDNRALHAALSQRLDA